MILVAKEIEEGDGIGIVAEERVDPCFGAKRVPDFPMGILGFGSFLCDAIDDVLLYSELMRLEDMSELGWQTRQDSVCGYV